MYDDLAKAAGLGYFIMAVMFFLGYQSGIAHHAQTEDRRLQQAQRRINKGIRRNRR